MPTEVDGMFEIKSGYSGKAQTLLCRNPRDVEEMAAHCNANSHIWFVANNGTARQAKVNGAVRRWKRTPGRIEVPIKYGLYEYATFDQHDIQRVLIVVRGPQ